MSIRLLESSPESLSQLHRKAGWLIGFNLLWSLWVFGDVLFGRTIGTLWIATTMVSFSVFLVLYALTYLRPLREMPLYSMAMAVLGWATMPVNHAGGTSYIIFACAFIAFQGTVPRAFAKIGLVLLLFVAEAIWLDWPWMIIVMMAGVAFSVGAGNMAYRLSWEKEAELRLSHEEVRKLAATAERERIGRDLHDLLGHTLSLITLKLELSRKLLDRDTEAARRELSEAENVARHALAEVRSAVTGFREADLAAEMASARLLFESSAIVVEYDLPPPLPAAIEHALALVLREAATNIARHAHATSARITFAREGDKLRMRVIDNGRGGIVDKRYGNGLTGMRERVQALGGSLAIESTHAGTSLEVVVPLPASESTDGNATTDMAAIGALERSA